MKRGSVAWVATIGLLVGLGTAHAEYVGEAVTAWGANTQAEAPLGLGPVRFDMSPARVRRICEVGWTPPSPARSSIREQTAGCQTLSLDLGFQGYSASFDFVDGKLVSVTITKSLDDGGFPFIHARDQLTKRYGVVPDRTEDYRNAPDPRVRALVGDSDSLYQWRFPRSTVRKEASKIELVRFNVDGTPQMVLTYDSQRRQDLQDAAHREVAQRLGSGY